MDESPLNVLPSSDSQVPWNTRDIWFGLGVFVLWTLIAVGFSIALDIYDLNIEIGIFIAFWELFLLIPTWWFTVRKYGADWNQLGLRRFDAPTLVIGCGLMVLSSCINFFYNLAAALLGIDNQIEIVNLFKSMSTPWPLLVAGILVAPFVEELFFRGFVFSGFREKYGPIPAALISAGLFSIAHLQPISILPIFLIGLIFAYLYHRTNSIWPAMIMHLATNTLGLGAAYLLSKMDFPALELSSLPTTLMMFIKGL